MPAKIQLVWSDSELLESSCTTTAAAFRSASASAEPATRYPMLVEISFHEAGGPGSTSPFWPRSASATAANGATAMSRPYGPALSTPTTAKTMHATRRRIPSLPTSRP
jgi:hypothetical protein